MPKRKRGRKIYRSTAKLPRRAGLKTKLQFEQNKLYSRATMQTFRAGFQTWWRVCPDYLRQIKLKPKDEYDVNNQHKGKMFALGREFKLTGRQCAQILLKCHAAGLSREQCKQAMKTMSYAFFLKTGKRSKNFPMVKQTWEKLREFGDAKRVIKPKNIPTTIQLRRAFTTPWHEGNGMNLLEWLVGSIAAFDWTVLGIRTTCDTDKIKKSEIHVIDAQQGWCLTAYDGGRSKLMLNKSGTRPWNAFRVCLCKGEHISPPPDVEYCFDKKGNLMEDTEITWDTNCILAAVELVHRRQWKHPPRCYPKLGKNGQFNSHNVRKPHELANRWFLAQGVTETPFSGNCGRKSLARWLTVTNSVYHESFQIHADLEKVWREHYQPTVENPTGFKLREQSEDPAVATAALRKFARWIGRGASFRPVKPLSRMENLMVEVLKGQGLGERALEIMSRFE